MCLLAACSAPTTLFQSTATTTLLIDGTLTDWKNGFQKNTKPDVNYQIHNDKDFVYIGLKTTDVNLIRQIGFNGLWVQFDGGKEFGKIALQYPLGMMGSGQIRPPRFEEEAERFIKGLLHQPAQFELFTEATPEGKRLQRNEIKGIEVSTTFEEGTFSYELKMPLKPVGASEYGTGFSADNRLNLRINTTNISSARPERQSRDQNNQQDNNRPNERMNRREMPRMQPLNLSLNVKLAF